MRLLDYAVIGKGLMGAAAGRYLSQAAPNTAIIGPDEPTDWREHTGVFASHYDQGRITRRLSKDLIWSTLAQRAIAQYPRLEAQSGVRFHFATGGLYVSSPTTDDGYLDAVSHTAHKLGAAYTEYAAPRHLEADFPFFRFPPQFRGIFEPPPAGYINPRDLIRAQLTVAAQQGATVIRETAVALHDAGDYWEIETDAGGGYRTRKALAATGAFANCYDLLPRKLALRLKSETILLAELPPAEATRLQKMPTLIYQIDSPVLESVYLLPPIEYPNGRAYLKMGCNTIADQTLRSCQEIRRWFIQGDSDVVKEAMRQALLEILPGLQALSFATKRCVITYTPHGKPYIDALQPGRLYLATGGNGSAAKSSDAIGRLAANLMQTGRWLDDLPAQLFRAQYAPAAL
jgi:sarcosine oxidase